MVCPLNCLLPRYFRHHLIGLSLLPNGLPLFDRFVPGLCCCLPIHRGPDFHCSCFRHNLILINRNDLGRLRRMLCRNLYDRVYLPCPLHRRRRDGAVLRHLSSSSSLCGSRRFCGSRHLCGSHLSRFTFLHRGSLCSMLFSHYLQLYPLMRLIGGLLLGICLSPCHVPLCFPQPLSRLLRRCSLRQLACLVFSLLIELSPGLRCVHLRRS